MLDVWMTVIKISLIGFGAGIGVGLFLALDWDKEGVIANYKKNWEPAIMTFIERYGD